MDKKKRRILVQYALLAALILLAALHYRSFLGDAWSKIRGLSVRRIILIVLLSLGYQLLEGAVIGVMMKKYVPDYSWHEGAECALVCSFFRFATLGSGGMAAEIVELTKDGAEPARAGGMAMVQYLLHKVTVSVYGVLGFLYLLLCAESDIGKYRGFLWIGTAVTALIAAFLILICTSGRFSGLCFWIAERLCGSRWSKKRELLKKQTDTLQDEAKSLLMRKSACGGSVGGSLWQVFFLDAAKLTCWYLVPCVVLKGKTAASMSEIVALTASAQMLAGVIPAPGGIGSLEFAFMLFSERVVGKAEAISAMLLLRAAINLIPFLPGLFLKLKRAGR